MSTIIELTIAVVSAFIINAEGNEDIKEIKNLNIKNSITPNPKLKNTFFIISMVKMPKKIRLRG